MKEKIKYIIPLILLIFGILSIVIRLIVKGQNGITFQFVWANLIGALLILYPLCEKILKIKLPLSLEIMFAIHIMIGVNLGTGYRVYDSIEWWDVLAHGYFGVEAAIIAYFILIHTNAHDMTLAGKLVFFYTFGMGCGGFWEIIEYITDKISGDDAQHVFDMANGLSPVADTMEDMMITFVGVTVFVFVYLIDYFANKKIINFIDDDFGYKKIDSHE